MARWHFRPHPPAPRQPYTDRKAPLPYPAGWFMLAPSGHLRPGGVMTCRLMGEDVVLYRTRTGKARVVRPYCPHLGAHLGCGGRVDGELIVCPFHHFAFDGDGALARVGPGYTGAAVRDKLTVLPCQEANGAIFTWVGTGPHDPPSWPLPDLLPATAPPAKFAYSEIQSHPQEILENIVDAGHLRALHGFTDSTLLGEPVADGHTYGVTIRIKRPFPPFGTATADFTLMLHGLGLGHVAITDPSRRWQIDAMIGARPTNPWSTQAIFGAAMSLNASQSALSWIPSQGTAMLSRALTWLNLLALLADTRADMPIWKTKRYTSPPRLAHGDGPIGAYRKWAQQFYPTTQ
ncbi:Rieske 2Fe-2S domain-containing protein [Streptomyces sp. VNUA116]|uniref:Rieske 2Fe-2S domain-containing protein n=1 Tax=Streptomyces sp. VNUA116 TaxID=3062449 RepID=UPI00267467C8|nr:Rieske 2Fe-2S domain-containing protein [Streptomyces sp. VNUA116]WKU48683.1 Rieske 2Fe-2S domain-containing protein [Streptomyces sp. VNUA116]